MAFSSGRLALLAMETRLKGSKMETFRKNLSEFGSETCSTCHLRLLGCMYSLNVVYDDGKIVARAVMKNGKCEGKEFYSLPCVNTRRSKTFTGGFQHIKLGGKYMRAPQSFIRYLGINKHG